MEVYSTKLFYVIHCKIFRSEVSWNSDISISYNFELLSGLSARNTANLIVQHYVQKHLHTNNDWPYIL